MALQVSSAKHSKNNRSFQSYTIFFREEKMEYSPSQNNLDIKAKKTVQKKNITD